MVVVYRCRATSEESPRQYARYHNDRLWLFCNRDGLDHIVYLSNQ